MGVLTISDNSALYVNLKNKDHVTFLQLCSQTGSLGDVHFILPGVLPRFMGQPSSGERQDLLAHTGHFLVDLSSVRTAVPNQGRLFNLQGSEQNENAGLLF